MYNVSLKGRPIFAANIASASVQALVLVSH